MLINMTMQILLIKLRTLMEDKFKQVPNLKTSLDTQRLGKKYSLQDSLTIFTGVLN